ncbi:hypothetical protein HDU92_002453 [Lobulomyces angularis]|nr:hypothetical protein HDU92_002453 [Lobulomyces angularis]
MHSADDLKLKKLKQQKTQYLIEYKKILNDNSIYQNNIKFFPSAELNLFLDKKDINEDLESLGLRGQKLKKENLELFNQQQHVQNNTNSIHSSHISTSSSLQNMSTQLQKQQKLQNQLSSLQQQPQQQQQKQYITLPSPTAIFDHQHQLPLPNGILLNKGDLIQFQDVYTRFQCKVLGWSQGEVWLGRLSDGSKKRLTYSNVIEGKVLLTPL